LLSLSYLSRPPDADEKEAEKPPRKRVAITKDESADPGCGKEKKAAPEGDKRYAHLIYCYCFLCSEQLRTAHILL
jgi:hypothetical protein